MIINIDSEKIYSTSLALIDVVDSYENLIVVTLWLVFSWFAESLWHCWP